MSGFALRLAARASLREQRSSSSSQLVILVAAGGAGRTASRGAERSQKCADIEPAYFDSALAVLRRLLLCELTLSADAPDLKLTPEAWR